MLLFFLPLSPAPLCSCFKNWRENGLGGVKEAQKKPKPEKETVGFPQTALAFKEQLRGCVSLQSGPREEVLFWGSWHQASSQDLLISSTFWRWKLQQLLHGLTPCAGLLEQWTLMSSFSPFPLLILQASYSPSLIFIQLSRVDGKEGSIAL